MTELVTFITPVAEYHRDLIPRVRASVQAQTIACKHLVMEDVEGRGAGYIRNRLLEQVTTPFVVFLDADDTVDPTFTEKTLAAWQPGSYVYTGWWDNTIKPAPLYPWQVGKKGLDWHVITALIPTYAVRFVGGFDEVVKGGEDAYLFWALTRRGLCGIIVDEPLFYYSSEGQRARTFVKSADHFPTMDALVERYKDMACCGDKPAIEQPPANEPFDGSVLALATWAGNRVEVGPVSGRVYARTGNGKQIHIDARDMQARPDLWRPAEQPKIERIPVIDVLKDEPQTDIPHGVHEVAARLFPDRVFEKALSVDDMRAMQPVGKPNFGQVVKLAGGQ